MRKSLVVALLAGLGVAASYVYYATGVANDFSDVSGYSSWMQSFFWRFFQKLKATAQNATGQTDYMDNAVSLIADFEGFSPRAYNDAGKWAIGYGHDIVSGDGLGTDSVIDEPTARDLLRQDAQIADDCISRNVQVPLSDNQRAALVSFVYNVGCGAFSGSTLLRLLNQGDYDGAASQFAAWNKSQGQVIQALVDRRDQEAGLFVS